jgi:formylglycine-generating enzyme required for sulfatase activity
MWTNSVSVPFLWIPAGTFPMGKSGDAEDSPVHEVTFSKGFWIGKYEVTQAQWVAIMETNPSGFKGENRPVENVSFEEVQEFIRRLNEKEGWNKYSLPTEAQWEYTARANTNTKYSWGDRMEKNRANCTNCGSTWDNKETAPIGSFAANPWGMSDMNGNVMEWVNDWYGDRYYTTPEANQDPKGPAQGENRVIRGGGFDINAEDLQSHVRGFVAPNFKRNDLGFRLVVSMQP